MTYELFIADRAFSSWSLRGWLMFVKFGLPVTSRMIGLYSGTMAQDLAEAGLAPSRLVPVMRSPEGIVLGETLAMAEMLAERHPEAGLWPEEPAARAFARWLVAEMHAGFNALRDECPCQLLYQYKRFEVSAAVQKDLDRLQELWSLARRQFGVEGPWLFGRYSLADVFYAPVAARIAGYALPVGEEAAAYVRLTLEEEKFRQWRALGLTVTYDPVPYAKPLPTGPWPGPAPIPALAVASGPSINETCPYSGDPVTDFAEIDGKVIGFCNPTCRDKTVNDPAAWPATMALLR